LFVIYEYLSTHAGPAYQHILSLVQIARNQIYSKQFNRNKRQGQTN